MAIYIDERVCKGCGVCVMFCPKSVLEISKRRNEMGYEVAEVIHPDKCKPCKLCEISCPDLAICVETPRKAKE